MKTYAIVDLATGEVLGHTTTHQYEMMKAAYNQQGQDLVDDEELLNVSRSRVPYPAAN